MTFVHGHPRDAGWVVSHYRRPRRAGWQQLDLEIPAPRNEAEPTDDAGVPGADDASSAATETPASDAPNPDAVEDGLVEGQQPALEDPGR